MAEIIWSRSVEHILHGLSIHDQLEFYRVIGRLRAFPESGRLIETGRYRNCRSVPFGRFWVLYYRVIGSERRCRLVAIRDGRRRPI